MFRRSAWRLAASVKAAAEPSLHTIQVSKAQGIAKGLTGGTSPQLALLGSRSPAGITRCFSC